MKKLNKLISLTSIAFASTAAIVPASIFVTSCSKSLLTTIYNDAVKEIKEVCSIPRVSNQKVPVRYDESDDNLFQVRNYLVNKVNNYMGKDVAIVDDARNVYFDIPASKGCEQFQGITLQAHMDMVWDAQGEAKSWDYKKHAVSEPVIEEVDGKLVMHTKDWLTSLGADDGQGIGAILSITKNRNKFNHGLIRCVITADEETSGNGASHIGIVNGKQTPIFKDAPYLITLDLPHGGKVADTSAGVTTTDLKISNLDTTTISDYKVIELSLTDFLGGHSGEDIDAGRSNAIKVAASIMKGLIDSKISVRLNNFSSTCNAMNKIPADAKVVFIVGDYVSAIEKCQTLINNALNELKKGVETNAKIVLKEHGILSKNVLTVAQSQAIINLLNESPFGPYDRFEDDGFVGSSANLSPLNWIESNANQISIKATYSIRFGKEEWLDTIRDKIHESIEKLKKDIEPQLVSYEDDLDLFPVWERKENNKLVNFCLDSHKAKKIEATEMKSHGGLETALIVKNHPEITAIALGATDLNEHSVKEQLFMDEYKNLCNVLIEMLTNNKL